jgi:hypothetical protein
MWILTYFPDFLTHVIFILGVLGTIVGFLLGFIPGIKPYQLAIQVISILILSFGLYLEGGLAEQAIWQAKVKDLEVKIAEAETKSEKVTTEVVTKILTKKQIIKEKGEDIVQFIDREVVKYDTKFIKGADCELPDEFFNSLNQAVGEEK